MERETMKFDVTDDLGMCMINVSSFFNILKSTDWNDSVIVDIAGTGKTLQLDMSKKVDEVCGFVQKFLGRIEIRRTWSPLPDSGPGEIVAVKFTASKILNKVLQEDYGLIQDIILEISPGPATHEGGNESTRALTTNEGEIRAQGDVGQKQPDSKTTVTHQEMEIN